MTQNRDYFREFKPHTKLKHALLDAYIVAWAMKLMLGHVSSRLAIIDAMAGEGRDAAGNEGSPLIAARRAVDAMDAARGKTPGLENPKIDVFAIEAEPGPFEKLTRALAPFTADHPDVVRALRGELADHLDDIRRQVGDVLKFYFVDPFGIKGLDAATYPAMLAGSHDEVFVLFSDIGAVRLHGVVTADRADAHDAVREVEAWPNLFPEMDAQRIAEAELAARTTNDALDLTAPASREHLTRALGGEQWLAELEGVDATDRADVFLRMFRNTLVRSGARFVLSLPMRDDAGVKKYVLVHASKSSAAFKTMKEAVSTGLRKGLLSESASNGIIADISVDISALVAALSRSYAGKTISWAGESIGVKAMVLEHSPIFHLQCDELKAALKSAGILVKRERKEVCVFPAETGTARGGGVGTTVPSSPRVSD